MASPNLQEIHDFLFGLALKAGDMITSANPGVVDTKKNCMPLLSEGKRGICILISGQCSSVRFSDRNR